MTIINRRYQRVLLHQSGTDHFWKMLQEHYAGDSAARWRKLAMLSLRVNSGWSLEQLGFLFGRNKSEIARVLQRVRKELRARFQVDWRQPARDTTRTPPLSQGGTRASRDPSKQTQQRSDHRRDARRDVTRRSSDVAQHRHR